MSKEKAYKAGYDCGMNGASTVNCHFAIFSKPEYMREWEKGKSAAKIIAQENAIE